MNKQMKIAIFAIIALGAIGFAAITISLRQNGTATISGIESNFTNNIQFETVYVDEQSKTDGATVSIAPDRKSFTFTTQALTSTQESFQINYNIRNKSQYGARIGGLTCQVEGTAKDYVDVQENNDIQDSIIKPTGISCSDSVLIYLNKSYADTTEQTLKVTCSLQATATIATDGKSITFTTQTLDTLNEQAVLTYKIKNDSQYNAQLGEMNCSSDDTDYVQITRGGALTNTTIAKGETSAADTITVKLVKTYSETTPKKVTITCDLNATAQSAAA